MTKRFITYAISALALTGVISSCNDDKSEELSADTGMTAETLYSSTAITSFSLKDNSKVLTNLSGVFFTIDLNNAIVFNADSLPYGTNVKKLLMNIGTPGENKVEVTYIQADSLKSTTIEYSSSSYDSINFTEPVTLKVTSVNQSYTREYSLKVNVHKVKSDSLSWGDMQYAALPGTTSDDVAASATVLDGNKLYCYTLAGNQYSRAVAPADLAEGETRTWEVQNSVNFGFTPDLNSMNVAGDKFYVLSTDGLLYLSDDGLQWTSTGQTWSHIYGAYDNYIVGVKQQSGKYIHTAYPAPQGYVSTEVADGCPISGTSQMQSFGNEWAQLPLALFVGGKDASGQLSGGVWGYDGTNWALLGKLPSNVAFEEMTLVPYFTFKTNTSTWTFTKQPTLLALCGRNSDGYLSRKVYISRDQGLNWHEADELMQLPDDMSAFAAARGFVCKEYLNASSAAQSTDAWKPFNMRGLPAWWSLPTEYSTSRAVKPIESWECPYIYVFGGEDAFGHARNQVWRGVINRLTFKPLE
ncbi:MAG: DUF6242 domain-containing protein [Muribaculum sp.]|nr:DUF6242 domain-containing protein [Muribaculum sp.]